MKRTALDDVLDYAARAFLWESDTETRIDEAIAEVKSLRAVAMAAKKLMAEIPTDASDEANSIYSVYEDRRKLERALARLERVSGEGR